ncbi:MAG: glutathione peroxidase [Flavobacteriales bacterium]|nr:glutathione peroxidase [Flavobacteriales bacterium]
MNLRKIFTSFFKSENIPVNSIHNLSIKTLEGEPFSLSQFKGKKLLIVNVASACGLTPQYEQLQQLYVKYHGKLEILGIPCNDFAGQEPGTPEQILEFCKINYDVSFLLTEKVNIKTEPIHPLYTFLTRKENNGLQDSEVDWNFQKYLLNEQGVLIQVLSPATEPLSSELCAAIDA